MRQGNRSSCQSLTFMKCVNCNQFVSEEGNFCGHCGVKTKQNSNATLEQSPYGNNYITATISIVDKNNKKSQKFSKYWYRYAIMCGIVVLLTTASTGNIITGLIFGVFGFIFWYIILRGWGAI